MKKPFLNIRPSTGNQDRAEASRQSLTGRIDPRLRKLIRILLIALTAFLFFYFICPPMIVIGSSMKPTYSGFGFLLTFRPAFLFRPIRRFDVVVLRYDGRKRHLLKRVLAFEGECVEFRRGRCFVNGVMLPEPYVQYPCDWELSPRIVAPGKIFVMGDNRSMPLPEHVGGQIRHSRVEGIPLW